MAAFKTIKFLPEIFQTETNKKFLNATFDQLVSEPNFKKINGYIGRKFAPTYRSTDGYIQEPDKNRQNYQLEPSTVVFNPETSNVDFYSGYIDLVNKVKYYGGIADNHSRMFDSEFYTFDGKFDFDKFINFSQYYWLPNGPDTVSISASSVPLEYSWDVEVDPVTKAWKFSGRSGVDLNPNITMAYGGTYTFNVKSGAFYIQGKPTTTGFDPTTPGINQRAVMGVTNNGATAGQTVTFKVPQPDGQKRFTNMIDPTNGMVVEYATAIAYRDIQGSTLTDLNTNFGGLDNTLANPTNKKVIFVGPNVDDAFWTPYSNLDSNQQPIDPALVVPESDRTKTWIVSVDVNGVINLLPYDTIEKNKAVFVKSGKMNIGKYFYVDYTGFYKEIPLLTASATNLYYQNAESGTGSGLISLVSPGTTVVNPDVEIIGNKQYTSPTGVIFTNGLKIKFDETVFPRSYYSYDFSDYNDWRGSVTAVGGTYTGDDTSATAYDATGDVLGTWDGITGVIYKSWYVEGVGKSIRLVNANNLIAPELENLNAPDYLLINRSSLDGNAWSRANRWFHVDVIRNTAKYNNTDFMLDDAQRANRAIIEFDADLKLFNYGKVALEPVNQLDDNITDAYSQVETRITDNPDTLTITTETGTTTLVNGQRIIFSKDTNATVRTTIYKFKIVNISDNPFATQYIGIIVPSGKLEEIQVGNDLLVLVTGGANASKQFYYDGTQWLLCQQKTSVNQAPLFDVFDLDGVSFGDPNTYNNTTFAGTKLFSYMQGTGTNDSVLGFPLSYRTFNNIGDIQFENNWDTETFTYLVSPNTLSKKINSGYLHTTIDLTNSTSSNIWTKVNESSKQYQIISYVADGTNNLFEIDVLPEPSNIIVSDQPLPNVKVFVNNKFLTVDNFGLAQVGARYAILVNPLMLNAGDAVNILIYSNTTSKLGFYEVPDNLSNNSLNSNFESLTLGQMRNHLTVLSHNSQNIVGEVPGLSNIRDLNIKSQGGTILKHSSPVVYSNLFLVDSTMNFVDGIRLAQKEYSKIKNKILELATTSSVNVDDIPGSLDNILYAINGVKNKNFPWFYSDMIPWGENKTVLPEYTVIDPRVRTYELSTIFDAYKLSNRAVLIYLTRTTNNVTTKRLLVHKADYVFLTDTPGFRILDSFNLDYDDVLTVVEYNNTDANFIPETPTKLGLYPKFIPEIYVDDTYANGSVTCIRGHDGSVTPAFGDYRDDILLEFERRIYNNIKIENSFTDLIKLTPGAFRDTEYTLTEWTQVLSNSFLAWVGNNRLDYSTNDYFESSNPWTWNYKNFKDNMDPPKQIQDRNYLQGTWRAIYKYFFDTETPHIRPWEMLGFDSKPDYWDDRYGPAPYTGGNLVLWNDLANGYIHAGPRAGFDLRFARRRVINPETNKIVRLGLLDIIPVDESGNLRPPSEILVSNFASDKANASYAIGDCGPVETAWRRSSDYPYSIILAAALLKPAKFFGSYINIDRITLNTELNQWLSIDTNQHIIPTAVEVNGHVTSNGDVIRTAGYINWISDYLKNLGVGDPPTVIKTALLNLNTQLSYKSAGFTDKKYLKVLAEQGSPSSTNDSIVIPDENYKILLQKSVPVNRISYSAVVVEKSANGYTVSGYNLNNPYFTIVPSLANNNTYSIKVGKYTGVIFRDYQKVRVRVPYGFEFNTTQEVVDFLVSYQRQLQSLGFTFTDYDSDLKSKKDWVLSAKEFLTWAQQGWKEGNVIVLSPVNETLNVSTNNGVIDEITNLPYGSKLLDTNFSIIKHNALTVTRQDNRFSVTTIKGQSIAFADLNVVQYEHVMVFDNTTSFNDVIYSPDTGNRQYRLKFIGNKTADWTGVLNPPGFIYNDNKVDEWQQGVDYKKGALVKYKSIYFVALNDIVATELFDTKDWKQINESSIKTGLLPNFATSASSSVDFYDIDNQPVDETLNFYSNGLLGFRERRYLTDLSLDTSTQSKFYQGYIKQKGTKNSILALAKAQIANISNEVNLYEEWALRVGEYGATDNNKFVEVLLEEHVITANPSPIELISSSGTPTPGFGSYRPNQIYRSNIDATDIFDVYESSAGRPTLPVAGYPTLEQVDTTVYDLINYQDLSGIIDTVGVGYTIWTAKGVTGNWDVYRVSETGCRITSLNYSIDNIATFNTSQFHNLEVGDIVAVKSFDTRFDGFYQIYAVPSTNSFTVALRENYAILSQLISISGQGLLFKLTSSRIAHPYDIDSIIPPYGWRTNDKVWVDDLDGQGNWGVYNKTSPWGYATQIDLNSSEYQGRDRFGTSQKLSPDGTVLYVGAPGTTGVGRAAIFLKTSAGDWVENSNFVVNSFGVEGIGQSIDANKQTFVFSAPRSNSSKGYVFVYSTGVQGTSLLHIITNPSATANDRFGYSIATSNDGEWLYVGSPGNGCVYVYGLVSRGVVSQTISANGSNNDFTLTDQTYTDASNILVSANVPLIPNVNYTIVDVAGTKKLRFLTDGTPTPPAAGSYNVNFQSHYELRDTLTQAPGFGYSVKCNQDGTQIVIGSNSETANGATGNGKLYVYERSIESFIALGTQNIFTTFRNIGAKYDVTVNGVKMIAGTNYNRDVNTIQLLSTPAGGSIVNIETNYFTLLQTINSPEIVNNQAFGSSVDIDNLSCNIYATAPFYKTTSYQNGVVYRFINTGRCYGEVNGIVANPTVTPGHSIRINNIVIQFTESTLSHVINKINGSGIPGVTAYNNNGYLKITSSNLLSNNKLNVAPNTGTALSDLGLVLYTSAQTIRLPRGSATSEFFGESVKVSDTSDVLAIGSKGADNKASTVIDGDFTTFDNMSTIIVDTILGTGSVYIYDLMENPNQSIENPGLFAFVQQLTPGSSAPNPIASGSSFGSSIDIKSGYITVGATTSPANNVGGSIYAFSNPTGIGGWDLISYKEPSVDPASIDKMYIYNTRTQSLIARLDHYDPAKGKILGVVDTDLDYISEEDPAVYNDGPGSDIAGPRQSFNVNYHWGELQEGKTWWDTSLVRYVEYEQGSPTYRSRHWGDTFPGSTIAVYEWVKSIYLPSEYVANGGNGVPKYTNNSNYVSSIVVDPSTGIVTTYHYYWVEQKTTVDINKTNRTNSVYTIAQILRNPKDQGIPYAAAISRNALNLYNISNSIVHNEVALHVDFSPAGDTNIIHSEYQLVQEGSSTSNIPQRIVDKLQDSLSGVDSTSFAVPDPDLSESNRLGIGIRPRQSMFIDRSRAVENFVKFVNNVFAKYPIAQTYSISKLNAGEPIPAASTGQYDIRIETGTEIGYVDTSVIADGTKVLIVNDSNNDGLWTIYQWSADNSTWSLVKIQSYATSIYWKFIDWYASDFDNTQIPTYTVNNYYEISKLNLVTGDVIKLNNNGQGLFTYYRVDSNLNLSEVGIQNGTIQILDSVYDLAAGNMGYDNDNYDTVRFDQNPILEIRNIFAAVSEDIFIKELKIEFNNLFFSLINYIFSEQKTTDWIFKTSFLSVDHKIRDLIQYPSYVKDNQTFYEDYINEVKPFRSTIREYVPRYTGTEYLHTGATDFDLPSDYDPVTKTYRSPDGQSYYDAQSLSSNANFRDWYNNHTYQIVELVVDNPGVGYTLTPSITIVGGGGTGATATAQLDLQNQCIGSAIITNPGKGYTSTPQVIVNGNGTGAVLSAKLKNVYYRPNPADSYNTIRTIDTCLIFDRVSYSANVVNWEPNTAYSATITTGAGTGNIWLSSGNLVQHNNKLYYPVTANVVDETTFDATLYQLVSPANILVKANDRVLGCYDPTPGMPAKNLYTLVGGLEYTGVSVDGTDYANTYASLMDTTISSSYLDTALGTRPEDITVDGGAYYDTNSSHAPEELIPGKIYDTLDMKVFTATALNSNVFSINRVTIIDPGFGYDPNTIQININGMIAGELTPVLDVTGRITEVIITDPGYGLIGNANPVITVTGANVVPATVVAYVDQNVYSTYGYRTFHAMTGNVEYTRTLTTTTLAQDLQLTDTSIVVADSTVLPEPNIELGWPGVLFINGEKIHYYTKNDETNSLGQLRRGVDGTGAPTTHTSGSLVYLAGMTETVPDTYTMLTESFIADGSTNVFTCTTLEANLAAYISTISVYVNNVPANFYLISATPNVEIGLVDTPAAGDNVEITGGREHTWLNLSPGAPKTFVTGNGDTLVSTTGDIFTTVGSSNILDGSGVVGAITRQFNFIKGLE